MKRLLLALGVAPCLFAASPAGACECATDAFVLPVGESNVPVNARIFARGDCVDPVLRDAAGEIVPLELEPDLHGMVVRRPAVPLALGGSYTVVCGASGGSFTVATSADATPPPAPTVTRGPFVSEDGSSCGDEHHRTFEVVTSDARLLLLDLEERDTPTPVIDRSALPIVGDTTSAIVGQGACRSNWDFEAHGQPYVRWSTLDLAGNQSAWTAWDVVVEGCAVGPRGARPRSSPLVPFFLLGLPWLLRRGRDRARAR